MKNKGWFIWFVLVIVWIYLFCAVNHCQTVDKKFVIASSLVVATSIYDVESTFHALDGCSTCKEGNPLMRPFVKRGRFVTYAFTAVVDTALIYTSYRMKKSGNKFWWLIPAEISIGRGVVATFNMRF